MWKSIWNKNKMFAALYKQNKRINDIKKNISWIKILYGMYIFRRYVCADNSNIRAINLTKKKGHKDHVRQASIG